LRHLIYFFNQLVQKSSSHLNEAQRGTLYHSLCFHYLQDGPYMLITQCIYRPYMLLTQCLYIYICFGDLMHFHYQKINFFVPCYIEIYYFQMKFISSFFFFFLTTTKKMSPGKPYNTFKIVCNKLKMPQQPKLFKIQMTTFYSSFQL
jgi:hypothetical protein